MQLPTPEYFIVGERPVKIVRTEKGELGVYAYNWETGDFNLAMDYLSRIYFGTGEIEQVSEEAFEKQVETLRAQLKNQQQPGG